MIRVQQSAKMKGMEGIRWGLDFKEKERRRSTAARLCLKFLDFRSTIFRLGSTASYVGLARVAAFVFFFFF